MFSINAQDAYILPTLKFLCATSNFSKNNYVFTSIKIPAILENNMIILFHAYKNAYYVHCISSWSIETY